MSKFCFGIDVGGTTVKFGFFTEDGTLIDKWEIKTRTENHGEFILSDIKKSIEESLAEKSILKEDIIGVGIGVPGPVNEEGSVFSAINLGWANLPVASMLHDLTGFSTKVANDANIAALGEMWKGGGVGHQNVVLVTLGTGVGGGIIINEKIVSGANGAGGEIGHMHVEDTETNSCNCGNQGCLEQVASATGVVRLAKKRLEKDDTPSVLREEEITAKAVFDAVKAGDPLAMEVAEQFGKYLGTALANIASVVDPEVIVIGGGVSKAGTVLLDYVKKYFHTYAFPACKNTPFALASLGSDAGIYGAAKLILA